MRWTWLFALLVLIVAPACEETPPWPDARPKGAEASQLDAEIQRFLQARPELGGAGLMVVHKDEGVVFEQFYGDLLADEPIFLASISKLFAAGMIMRLHESAILDIDRPISHYGWGSPSQRSPTLAQLLSNSSGMPCLADGLNPAAFRCQFRGQEALVSCGQAIWQAHVAQEERLDPDQAFCYGGPQWQLAGAVAQAISGQSWAQLFEQSYRGCGLQGAGFVNPFSSLGSGQSKSLVYPEQIPPAMTDNPNIEAGLWVTPRDVAKVLQMHLSGGRCGQISVLSPQSVARMQEDRIWEAYRGDIQKGMSESFLDAFGRGYGLSWWVHRDNGRRIVPGAFGSTAWISGDGQKAAIAVLKADGLVGRDFFTALSPWI